MVQMWWFSNRLIPYCIDKYFKPGCRPFQTLCSRCLSTRLGNLVFAQVVSPIIKIHRRGALGTACQYRPLEHLPSEPMAQSTHYLANLKPHYFSHRCLLTSTNVFRSFPSHWRAIFSGMARHRCRPFFNHPKTCRWSFSKTPIGRRPRG